MLNRSLLFQGEVDGADDQFGAHIIIRQAAIAKIEGIQVTKMGQQGQIGKYPIHFHRMYDARGKNVYVRNSAAHHNFQRCYVLHDTQGVVLTNNIGYNTNGHMYFLVGILILPIVVVVVRDIS
jgi:hypothetical protein